MTGKQDAKSTQIAPQERGLRCNGCGGEMSQVASSEPYHVYDCLECGRLVVVVGEVTKCYARIRRI